MGDVNRLSKKGITRPEKKETYKLAAHAWDVERVDGIGESDRLHVAFGVLGEDLLSVSKRTNMVLPGHSIRPRSV